MSPGPDTMGAMRDTSDKLLKKSCVHLGFCSSVADGQPLHVDQFLREFGVLTHDEIADAIFNVEG